MPKAQNHDYKKTKNLKQIELHVKLHRLLIYTLFNLTKFRNSKKKTDSINQEKGKEPNYG